MRPESASKDRRRATIRCHHESQVRGLEDLPTRCGVHRSPKQRRSNTHVASSPENPGRFTPSSPSAAGDRRRQWLRLPCPPVSAGVPLLSSRTRNRSGIHFSRGPRFRAVRKDMAWSARALAPTPNVPPCQKRDIFEPGPSRKPKEWPWWQSPGADRDIFVPEKIARSPRLRPSSDLRPDMGRGRLGRFLVHSFGPLALCERTKTTRES